MPSHETSVLSKKRGVLCSRENALRLAGRIFDAGDRACVIRTGDPIRPFRAAASASHTEEVETLLCA